MDGNNSLDELEYTGTTEKKGAPTDVSAPILDDFGYDAPVTAKKGMPTEVTAPVLDDMDYYSPPPAAKKGMPTGVSAPVLDDMDDYAPSQAKKGMPTEVTAPVLDDSDEPYQADEPDVLIMTDEEIIETFSPEQLETYNRLPDANKRKVIELMRKQLGAEEPPVEVTAPVLDEDNYSPPEKPAPAIEEEKPPEPQKPLTAPVLDDEPEPPKYQPKFVDEDLERAKREGAKQAVSSQLISEQKDSKESLRMMLELKEERRREEAQKGFKWVIVLAIVGLIGAVAFYLLYTGSLGLTYKDGIDGFAGIIKDSALYITIAMGATSLAMVSGIGFFKSLASLVYLLAGIIQVFPGFVMIAQHEGSQGLAIALYAIAIICTIGVFFGLSAVESVSLYFKRKEL